MGDEPNGVNINVGCGATDTTPLEELVTGGGYDLGIAFDGDGDRMLAVDELGWPIDGDQILAILALDLGVELVAVTQMTNLGFHALMREHGVRVVTTDVGDRYVLEAVATAESALGDRGRVLVRASGTEPLVRVMVEAPTDDEARAVAERIAALVAPAG